MTSAQNVSNSLYHWPFLYYRRTVRADELYHILTASLFKTAKDGQKKYLSKYAWTHNVSVA